MQSTNFNLQDNIVTVYGDLAKTFVTDKIKQKVVDGKTVLSPAFNAWFPVFDNFGIAPVAMYITPNNRVFFAAAPSAGLCRVMLYDFDPINNVVTPVGSGAANGGLSFSVINSPATTHTIRGFSVDDGANQAAVTGWFILIATTGTVTANGGPYMAKLIDKVDFTPVPTVIPTATLSDTKSVYKLEDVAFTITQSIGCDVDKPTTRLWMLNGVLGTYQAFSFNYSTSTGVPAANGIISTLNDIKTGNLPAVVGTILLTNCLSVMTPTASPNPAALLGNKCIFFMTGTNAYMGKISELTNGGTSWPSLTASNYTTPGLFINPTPTSGRWVASIDRMVLQAGVGVQVLKPFQSGVIDEFFGGVDSQYLEQSGYLSHKTITFGGLTTSQVGAGLGWVALVSTATSQRGSVAMQISSSQKYGQQYIITKVIDTETPDYYTLLAQLRVLSAKSLPLKFQYRTSGFASETVGWVDVATPDMTGEPVGSQIQVRVLFYVFEQGAQNAGQLAELSLTWQSLTEISENWAVQGDLTTHSDESPTKTTFQQIKNYNTAVPTLKVIAINKVTKTQVALHDTSTDFAFFSQSSDGGLTFATMTGPNDYADDQYNTVIRYDWTSPAGTDVIVGFYEA